MVCNHEWETGLADILTEGRERRGCPKCGRERTAAARRMSHTEYADLVRKHSQGQIKVVEKYVNSVTPIDHQCLRCEHVFKRRATVTSRYKNIGCPVCTTNGFSRAACEWMDYEAKQRGITIKHAKNGGEHVILIPNGTWQRNCPDRC
jgi:predicted  nucleic acid-binding Zn-ribbon protein